MLDFHGIVIFLFSITLPGVHMFVRISPGIVTTGRHTPRAALICHPHLPPQAASGLRGSSDAISTPLWEQIKMLIL